MISSEMNLEPVYVVDTHALIWYLTNDKKLGQQASNIFEAAERGETSLVVSAVVVAEMYYANQKHSLFPDFNQMYRRLRSQPYFRFAPLKAQHVLDFDSDAAIPEMHDRIIAGLACRLNAPLLTRDPQIIAAGVTRTIW
jgi:PIN domain nuclease of toxin-antitoxin system